MHLTALRYDFLAPYYLPAEKQMLGQVAANMEAAVQTSATALAEVYPASDASAFDIRWPDIEQCLRDPTGANKAGAPEYFNRKDADLLGYEPTFMFGGKTALGRLWNTEKNQFSQVPLWADTVMNPDLFAILLLVLLVVVSTALLFKAFNNSRRRRRSSQSAPLYWPAPGAPLYWSAP